MENEKIQKASKKIIKPIKKYIIAQNKSNLNYMMFHKRAALILETFYEDIFINLDYNKVPTSIIIELNMVNLMSILLEPVLKEFHPNEVEITLDGCLVYKEKVEMYNELLTKYPYYYNQNLGLIPFHKDKEYEWKSLTEEEIRSYYQQELDITEPLEALKLVCQLELLRNAQPYDVSLRLLEIRKWAEPKVKFENLELRQLWQTNSSNPDRINYCAPTIRIIECEQNSFSLEEDMVEQMAIEIKNIIDKIKKTYKESALVRRIKSVKENYKK